MTFKEQIVADIHGTFLNLLEFAGELTVDGRTLPAILDDNELIERKSAISSDKAWDGVFKAEKLLYVAASDLGARPRIGRLMNVGSRDYQVYHVTEEMGVYAIYLGANLSR